VLAGELLETVNGIGLKTALPYLVGSLATQILRVLRNPLHKLYGKVNRFLNKGPRWEIGKIPSYWIDRILLREPEYDDSHYVEVSWLLDMFIDGLRSRKVDLIQREILPAC
jgi:nucleolar pre-ribosomal-associated protein 1